MWEWLLDLNREELEEIIADKRLYLKLRYNAKRVLAGKSIEPDDVLIYVDEHCVEDPFPHEDAIIEGTEKAIVETTLKHVPWQYSGMTIDIQTVVPYEEPIIPYGIVIDAMTYSLNPNHDLTDEEVYYLPRFIKYYESLRVRIKDERLKELIAIMLQNKDIMGDVIKDMSGNICEVFVRLIRSIPTTNDNILEVGRYILRTYWRSGARDVDTDRYGNTVFTEQEPYRHSWYPISEAACRQLQENGIKM